MGGDGPKLTSALRLVARKILFLQKGENGSCSVWLVATHHSIDG
jgi:hypothetical protein